MLWLRKFYFFLGMAALSSAAIAARKFPEWDTNPSTRPDYQYQISRRLSVKDGGSSRTNGSHSSIELLRSYGLADLSSDEFYELDFQIRSPLKELLQKSFPGQFEDFDLVFLNTDQVSSQVIYYNSLSYHISEWEEPGIPPTIFLTRYHSDHFETVDEFLALALHEAFHVLRGKLAPNSWFDRMLAGQAEESVVCDLNAARVLVEGKRDPQAISTVVEKTLSVSQGKSAERLVGGFKKHPPTEIRLSLVNGYIEKLADKYDFPEPEPITGLMAKLRGTDVNPPAGSSQLSKII